MNAPRFSLLSRGLVTSALLCAVLALAGCDRSPTNDTLATDLGAYIESGHAPGLIEVTYAERLDHRVIPDLNRSRRTVSFAADLKLKRDYDFAAWDQANGAALTLLLGANSTNVKGLKAGGNKTGDVIRLTGSVNYVYGDRGWQLEANSVSPAAPQTPFYERGRLGVLADWRRMTAMTFRALFSPPGAFTSDLDTAVKAAAAREVRHNGGLAIASGEYGGTYWSVAEAIVNGAAKPRTQDAGLAVVNLASTGTRENLRLLRDGVVTAAILRGDEAALAARGEAPFERDGTFPDLRALASLFPEQIHVVVMSASPIASVADLFGKRVAVAAGGPAALLEAGDILRAHRVSLAALASTPDELPLAEALAALKRGEQDAVILTSPAPAPVLRDFAVGSPVRFLPLDADAVALLTTGTSSYVAVTMPAQTYPGQARPVATVGVAALLVSAAGVKTEEVDALLQRTFGGVDFMDRGSLFGGMIKRSTALRGTTVPLHDGAEAFYDAVAGSK